MTVNLDVITETVSLIYYLRALKLDSVYNVWVVPASRSNSLGLTELWGVKKTLGTVNTYIYT